MELRPNYALGSDHSIIRQLADCKYIFWPSYFQKQKLWLQHLQQQKFWLNLLQIPIGPIPYTIAKHNLALDCDEKNIKFAPL